METFINNSENKDDKDNTNNSETKNNVIYNDLCENEELKKYLTENLDLIKKYYMCGE
jgi:hypothetical protein